MAHHIVEEKPILSRVQSSVRRVEIVKGFPTAKTQCESDEWLRSYVEFRLDSRILIGFPDLWGKICVDDD